ncbi:Ppx/GppA phosphatase family protein [Nocardioides abyssi]|uniref:Ppx/GppA phosphatase family protein n=1 Tax=Nocardioides abyssi TaxID=3058370 RepID=A0ABT8EQA3_9ACTN|nr:Ppx/GppA phosphatase family protein [Nocardioides abyssi]MDN4160101.1 Ppx/GppA phosphatase family protein [Nocardioides abyssi]
MTERPRAVEEGAQRSRAVEEGAQRPSRDLPGPVAAIDCGTNSIRLLVCETPAEPLVREMRVVRLGEGIDATGRMSDAALERTFAALDDYAATIRDHGATRVRLCATSATRDAANAEVFTAGVRDRLGVEPDVVSGAEEAALSFAGAVRGLRDQPGWPVLVVDLGGGSTELVLGGPDGVAAGHSMDVGSVRLHERHLHTDPPTAAEVEACRRDVDAALDACPVDPAEAATVVGVAGTITTVAAAALGLTAYDAGSINQQVLPVADVRAATARLVAMTVAERRALPFMHPGRADVIGAGAIVLEQVVARAGVDRLVVSESDILDGIAWSLLD